MKSLADVNRANRAVATRQSNNVRLFMEGKARDATPPETGEVWQDGKQVRWRVVETGNYITIKNRDGEQRGMPLSMFLQSYQKTSYNSL